MSARYQAPQLVEWRGRTDVELRRRIERAVAAGVVRAVAAAGGDASGPAPPARSPATAGGAGVTAHPGHQAALPLIAVERRSGLAMMPSYDAGGAPAAIPVRAGGVRELQAEHGDRVVLAPHPPIPVLLITATTTVSTGGSEYVVSPSLARAYRWGRLLFGALGFAVLQPHDGPGFRTVPLERPFSPEELGRVDRPDSRSPTPGDLHPAAGSSTGARIGRIERTVLGRFQRPVGHRVVMVWSQLLLGDLSPAAAWPPTRVDEEMRATPVAHQVTAADAGRVAGEVLASREAAGQGDALLAELINMDRTIFQVVPWAERARYLSLLAAQTFLGARQKRAVVELVAAARTELELEAMFAILREHGAYERIFTRLEGTVVELLQLLGSWRPPGAATAQYVIDLFEELNLRMGSAGPGEDLLAAADGIVMWVRSTVEGAIELFEHPLPELLDGIAHLAEFLRLVQRAVGAPAIPQLGIPPAPGDPQAMRTLGQIAQRAGRAARQALAGLAYAEQLGSAFRNRGGSVRIGSEISHRLQVAVAVEVLTWFVGVGEVKAVVAAAGVTERLAGVVELLTVLARVARISRAGEAVAQATRLERLVLALARATGIADEAVVLRAVRLLPPQHLTEMIGLADVVDLTETATARALRARAATRGVQASVEELTEALTVATRLEQRAALAGEVTPEMTAALHRLLETGWLRTGLAQLVLDVPATRLQEWSRAVVALRPAQRTHLGLPGLAQLAYRPRSLRLVAEAGGDAYLAALYRLGNRHALLEGVLHGLELRRAETGDPAEFLRLLDRIAAGGAGAAEEIDRLVTRAAGAARSRLRPGTHLRLLAELVETDTEIARHRRAGKVVEAAEAEARRDLELAKLGELEDPELRGLDHLARLQEDSGVVDWSHALELAPTDRAALLTLVDDVAGRLPARSLENLEEVVGPILTQGGRGSDGTLMQGSWGQLYAARTLIEEHGATALSFERWEGRHRRLDIVAELSGRGQVSVEVKTNLIGAASTIDTEIRRDLLRHAGSDYRQLMYLYHPGSASELPGVGRHMLGLLKEPEMQQALRAAGHDPAVARAAFERWLAEGNPRSYRVDR